jgi:hypothetical protein
MDYGGQRLTPGAYDALVGRKPPQANLDTGIIRCMLFLNYFGSTYNKDNIMDHVFLANLVEQNLHLLLHVRGIHLRNLQQSCFGVNLNLHTSESKKFARKTLFIPE